MSGFHAEVATFYGLGSVRNRYGTHQVVDSFPLFAAISISSPLVVDSPPANSRRRASHPDAPSSLGLYPLSGGPGVGKLLAFAGAGWIAGAKVHSSRASKRLRGKHMQEQKNLYTQYYNDVYKLQESNAELAYVVEQLQATLLQVEQEREMEAIQRDYDEFKQPDVDGDDRISRPEFNMYVQNYLKNYPGLTEKDYPRFEDFDHDGDGFVSFQEYAQQMKLQAQKAEKEAQQAHHAGNSAAANKAGQKAQAVRGLYGDTRKADTFNDLYAAVRG